MEGARAILLSITGGPDLSLVEVSEAAKLVGEAAHPDANIIFGANVDEELGDQIWVTVVATRFDGRPAPRRAAEPTIRRTKEAPRGGPSRRESPGELGASTSPSSSPGRSGPRHAISGAGSSPPATRSPPRRGRRSCARAATRSTPRSARCSPPLPSRAR